MSTVSAVPAGSERTSMSEILFLSHETSANFRHQEAASGRPFGAIHSPLKLSIETSGARDAKPTPITSVSPRLWRTRRPAIKSEGTKAEGSAAVFQRNVWVGPNFKVPLCGKFREDAKDLAPVAEWRSTATVPSGARTEQNGGLDPQRP